MRFFVGGEGGCGGLQGRGVQEVVRRSEDTLKTCSVAQAVSMYGGWNGPPSILFDPYNMSLSLIITQTLRGDRKQKI